MIVGVSEGEGVIVLPGGGVGDIVGEGVGDPDGFVVIVGVGSGISA